MPPFYFLTFAKVSVSVSKTFGLKKSIGIGLEKKSRYRSRWYLVSKKSLCIGLKNIWSRKKVSVSVSKTFSLEKKSWYRSRKHLVSKESLGIGLENIWSRKKVSVSVSKILVSKKSLGIGLDEIFWSRHSVAATAADCPFVAKKAQLMKMTKNRQCGPDTISSCIHIWSWVSHPTNRESKMQVLSHTPLWFHLIGLIWIHNKLVLLNTIDIK